MQREYRWVLGNVKKQPNLAEAGRSGVKVVVNEWVMLIGHFLHILIWQIFSSSSEQWSVEGR